MIAPLPDSSPPLAASPPHPSCVKLFPSDGADTVATDDTHGREGERVNLGSAPAMRAIALTSRRSDKLHHHPRQPRNSSSSTATSATLGGATAWLITLWGAQGGTMAYAARSRAPCQGVPAFAARLSSLKRGGAVAGSKRWSSLVSSSSPSSSSSPVERMSWRGMGLQAALPGGGGAGGGGGALRAELPAGVRESALSMSSGGWSRELPGVGSGEGGMTRGLGAGTRYSSRSDDVEVGPLPPSRPILPPLFTATPCSTTFTLLRFPAVLPVLPPSVPPAPRLPCPCTYLSAYL